MQPPSYVPPADNANRITVLVLLDLSYCSAFDVVDRVTATFCCRYWSCDLTLMAWFYDGSSATLQFGLDSAACVPRLLQCASGHDPGSSRVHLVPEDRTHRGRVSYHIVANDK